MSRPSRFLLGLGAAAMAVPGIAIGLSASNAQPEGAVIAQAPPDGSMTDQVIVTFDASWRRFGTVEMSSAGTAQAVRSMDDTTQVIKLPEPQSGEQLEATMRRLSTVAGVVRVEPDTIVQSTSDDPQFDVQWALTSPASGPVGIDVEGAWAITPGSSSIRVAVIDTGIVDHADLAGRVVGGYDFISDPRIANDGDGRDSDARDPGDWISAADSSGSFFSGCGTSSSSWHGTHVAGTIGAATDNRIGVAGINKVSQIVPIRVLGKCGGYTSDIVDGMRWAAGLNVNGVPANPHPARVLNLSLGGGGACSSFYQRAVDDVRAVGTVVVVAAGNSNADASRYSPASCNGVIAVSATGKAANRAGYSNYGATVEIAAPGGDGRADRGDSILSTLNSGSTSPVPGGDIYARYQGTSMASPHVAGVVSLMLSANPALTPDDVTRLLTSTATPFPAGSSCANVCGAGVANAAAAVAASSNGSTPTTTTVAPTTTLAPTTTVAPTTTLAPTTTVAPTTTLAPTTTVAPTTTLAPTTTVAPTTTLAPTTTVAPTTTLAPTTTVAPTTTLPPVTTVAPTTTVAPPTTVAPSDPPGAFRKRTPSNRWRYVRSRAVFRWTASQGATSYEACLDRRVNRRCDTGWVSIDGTAAIARGMGRRTWYEWQVRAVNADGSVDADNGRWFVFRTR